MLRGCACNELVFMFEKEVSVSIGTIPQYLQLPDEHVVAATRVDRSMDLAVHLEADNRRFPRGPINESKHACALCRRCALCCQSGSESI